MLLGKAVFGLPLIGVGVSLLKASLDWNGSKVLAKTARVHIAKRKVTNAEHSTFQHQLLGLRLARIRAEQHC